MKSRSDETRAAEKFADLVVQIDGHRPHTQWTHIRQLPRLTSRDYSVILRAFPDELYDVLLDPEDLADAMDHVLTDVAVEATRDVLYMSVTMQLQLFLNQKLFKALQALQDEEATPAEAEEQMRAEHQRQMEWERSL